MNLHHLMIFDAVAAAGSVTAAADKLLISQPAISSQLKQLERTLGAPLFVRQPRGMALTAEGRVLGEYARRIFTLADEAGAAVRDVQGLRRGSLRVGASPAVAAYFLPPLLVHYQRRFPGVRLHVETAECDTLERQLRDGLLDLVLGPAAATAADVSADPFMREDFVAVAAPGHPLARRRPVRPEHLAAAFVARDLPSATGALALFYFAARDLRVRPVLSLGSVEAVKQAVIAGLGVTILSAMAVRTDVAAKRLRVIKVDGLPLQRTLYRVQRVSPDPKAVTAFKCLLKHAVRGTLPTLAVGGLT